jgi:HlyD family type I secretion membrane fusion protein
MTRALTLLSNQVTLRPALSDSPTADFRLAGVVVGSFLTVMLGWAALAPLDSAARAPGQISVYGHDQVVAHREGGVLAAVDVVEGQHVRAGQVLAQLAPDEVGATAAALRARAIALQAQQARLEAETRGLARIAWPGSFSTLAGDDQAAATAAQQVQQAEFDADLRTLHVQSASAASRAQGLVSQLTAGQGALQSNTREQELLDQQLTGVRTLAAKGFAPQNSLRALERSDAELSSTRAQIEANVAQYHQQIVESNLGAEGARSQFTQAALSALRETEDELSEVAPKLQAASAQLERGTLRAQTDGVVTGLTVFSPGAVVAPGQPLMEIVPANPRLVVNARLAANDTQGLHMGQTAEVRLMASGASSRATLKGKLTELSADSFVDEHTGRTYFTATVTVPESELRRLDGAAGAIRPGVPVEVMLSLQHRTAFEYLFEPLTQSLWRSFRQR